MRIALSCSLALAGLAAGGCERPQDFRVDVAGNVKEAGGLRVRVELPRRSFRVGDTIAVKVTATNTTGTPIQIVSPTGAPVLVRVARQTMAGPEQVQVYPRSVTSNILSWTIPAGESWPKTLRVPVEPDWPVHEVLYVSAELNGYGHLAPTVHIRVKPAGE
jgi:hypothetical protein